MAPGTDVSLAKVVYRPRFQSKSSGEGAPKLPYRRYRGFRNRPPIAVEFASVSAVVRQLRNCDSASIWSSCFRRERRDTLLKTHQAMARFGEIKEPASSFAVSPFMRDFLSVVGRLR